MTPSHEPSHDHQQLVRYLLGLLPEGEIERLDEASIVDDEVASELRIVEDDLVDAYVSGMLDPAARIRFEQHYLVSPRRREKVEFAKGFLAAVDRVSTNAPGGTPAARGATRGADAETRTGATARGTGWSKFAWPLFAAAALLLLVFGVVVFQDMRLRRELSEAQRREVEEGRRAAALAHALDEARAANAATAKALEDTLTAASTSPLAVVLFAQTRAASMLPAVVLSPAAERVAFELRLESNDFPRYRAELIDPATGRSLWRSAPLVPAPWRATSFVSVAVPAGMLRSQHYSFELAGLDAAGHGEAIASYAFQIARR